MVCWAVLLVLSEEVHREGLQDVMLASNISYGVAFPGQSLALQYATRFRLEYPGGRELNLVR